ncbi:MAG: hypothetical protein U0798_07445 [Gemmataceae bacterium]
MRSQSYLPALVIVNVLAAGLQSARADEPSVLREKVLKASTRDDKGAAYKAFLGATTREELTALTKDKDNGIALQAAWEMHTKLVKRTKPLLARSDDIYDPDRLAKFVAFLKERTKAPVPNWWAQAVTNVDVFPKRHHAFHRPSQKDTPNLVESKAGAYVLDGCGLDRVGDDLVYTTGDRTLRFPKATFDSVFRTFYLGALREKRSAIAVPSNISGYSYRVAGFEGNGGKATWTAEVWASGRDGLLVNGFHTVEMAEKAGVVYLFGVESHGAYAEAFDFATGECRWRFCSAYWWNWSEVWGKK